VHQYEYFLSINHGGQIPYDEQLPFQERRPEEHQ